MTGQALEERHWKIRAADQLALGKDSSWAIIPVPHTLTAPSAAATWYLPVLSHKVGTGNSAKAVTLSTCEK